MHRGQAGRQVFDSLGTTLADMAALQKKGEPLVVVHGGANLVTQWLKGQGVVSQFHDGERVTDRKSLDVVTAVLAGLANKETVAALLAAGGRAVDLPGVDGGLIKGKARDKALGYLGSVVGVDPDPLAALLDAGFMPVISPVSFYAEGHEACEPLLLNINGDTVAGDLAAAIHAQRLVFLTDVDAVHSADGKQYAELTPGEAQWLADAGVASGGMIPKLKACLVAARAGVVCHIVDGTP